MPEFYVETYFAETEKIARSVSYETIERLCAELAKLRERQGRLFFLGVGGSAGNCSHAVNDFRKLCGIEAYAPTDNVSELTARTNDEGWDTVFAEWLTGSRATRQRCACSCFPSAAATWRRTSAPTSSRRSQEAKTRGREGLRHRRPRRRLHQAGRRCRASSCRRSTRSRVTPHAEAFQAVVWHCLVSHPKLQIQATKW